MKKGCIPILLAMILLACRSFAQTYPCYSDEARRRLVTAHPEIQEAEAEMERQISEALKKIDYSKAARTTDAGSDTFWYDIPVVVHIIHDYGNNTEYLSDDAIFNDLIDWNKVFAKQNADTSSVIPPFVKWVGNARIRLHLATRDPLGNPTKGITRHRSYLTYIGGDQSKLDDWPPTSYVNIWSVNRMSTQNGAAAAYAYQPAAAASIPFYDGIMCLYNYVANDYTGATSGGISKTINHEMGHVFHLDHTWGNGNSPGSTGCTGTDNVDDTPPTKGHLLTGCALTANSLYDTVCATNYFKIYPTATGNDSLVNYPDTANAQNIMDYTYCARMFTIGQVERMHAALNSNVAGRNNLWDPTNLLFTGALAPRPDLKPVPDFAIIKPASSYMDRVNYFTFPGTNVVFYNESYNDTVDGITWAFSNGATNPSSTSKTSVVNSFTDPGWVTLTMNVSGNHTGDSVRTWPNALFVTNATGTPASDAQQDFSPSDNVASWPTFNYYNNEFKWKIANVGYNDNYSLEYTSFDSRIDPSTFTYPITGTPVGDFDDFFSIPVDFTGYEPGRASLNFDYSGASRSSNSLDINDTLQIDYTINKGQTWNRVAILSKGQLENKGGIATAYTPSGAGDWVHKSIDLPAAALTNYTTFRFRYKPNVGQDGVYGSGNNFYMDNIHFRPWPAAVNNISSPNSDMVVIPNPTSGDAFVVLRDVANTNAQLVVTDITGKVVFTISRYIANNQTQLTIPQSAVAVKGMYIIQLTTGAKTRVQKLVVN